MYESPEPEKIKALRERFGLTQSEAATQVHVKLRAWQWWESGNRKMPIGLWELFLIKADHHPKYKLVHKKTEKSGINLNFNL
jgi:DNA (cytosine-5)-methyltransferase 1